MKIVIDGNIGAGKTTQLSLLKRLGARVFKEPIEEWPLKEFYANPKKGIFPLQMAVLRTVCDQGPGIYERFLLAPAAGAAFAMRDAGAAPATNGAGSSREYRPARRSKIPPARQCRTSAPGRQVRVLPRARGCQRNDRGYHP